MKTRVAILTTIIVLVLFNGMIANARAETLADMDSEIRELVIQIRATLPAYFSACKCYEIEYTNGVLVFKYTFYNITKKNFVLTPTILNNLKNSLSISERLCQDLFYKRFITAGGKVKYVYYDKEGNFLYDGVVDSCYSK